MKGVCAVAIPVVIDSDTYNEIDDQFAIAYALCRPQSLDVRALFAAPFVNDRAETPAEGMQKSLTEMYRVRALCHSHVPIFAGSGAFLDEENRPVESPACDELIRLAHSMPEGKRLYVVAIAALTNVASALLKAPEIAPRLSVCWLGGNARDFADQNEFNLRQDRRAAQVLLDSGAHVVWFPCRGVCSHLSLTKWEAAHWLPSRSAPSGTRSIACWKAAARSAWANRACCGISRPSQRCATRRACRPCAFQAPS